jgi:hypothetical protein
MSAWDTPQVTEACLLMYGRRPSTARIWRLCRLLADSTEQADVIFSEFFKPMVCYVKYSMRMARKDWIVMVRHAIRHAVAGIAVEANRQPPMADMFLAQFDHFIPPGRNTLESLHRKIEMIKLAREYGCTVPQLALSLYHI